MRTRAAIIIAACLAGLVGCAKERGPINRVQANALDKSFFVGPDLQDPRDDPEFYKRGTVVDVVYGAGQDGQHGYDECDHGHGQATGCAGAGPVGAGRVQHRARPGGQQCCQCW